MKARLLPSGKYSVPINYYDEFGNRKQTSRTAATEAKALKLAQDFLDSKNTMLDDTTTLRDATRYYIETRVGIIQPTTIRTYIILAENAFRCLQKTRLCDLRPVDIQRAISIESKKGKPEICQECIRLVKSQC